MARGILRIGVDRALKLEARASIRSYGRRSFACAGEDKPSNRKSRRFIRQQLELLRRLQREVQLMMTLSEQCLEAIRHRIEQHEIHQGEAFNRFL